MGVKALCFVALLALLLPCASAAHAEPVADRIVEVLKDICVSPTTPEDMIKAGDKAAAIEGWKLIGAMPAPLPMLHNETGPKISFASGWKLELPQGSQAELAISIVRPEIAGVRYSVCLVQPSADVPRGSLAQSLEKEFGALLTKDISRRYHGSETWFFSQERSRGNCGKKITLLHDERPSVNNPRTLMFMDMSFPNDGNWNAPLTETICRP